MSECGFVIAWVGACKKPAASAVGRCAEHTDKKCVSCGEPATHECAATEQFVCGAPLCEGCGHYGGATHAPMVQRA